MPLTHEYPRYAADARFGLTASPRCNLLALTDPVTRHRPRLVCGAAEDTIVWNPATGLPDRKFREEDDDDFADEEAAAKPRLKAGAVACRLAWHGGSSTLAVGHSDGWIRLYNIWTGELLVKFCGHKNAIACMAFDADGALLAAGGFDSDITVLRVEGESGYRLQGHTNAVTQVHFLELWPGCLLSSSKDGLMKLWSLELRVCFKTVTGHPGEVWDFALMGESRDLLVTGSCDNQLRLWRLTSGRDPQPEAKRILPETGDLASLEDSLAFDYLGSVTKTGKGRVKSLSTAGASRLLCVCSAGGGGGLEWFATPDAKEQRLRLKQRQKKATRRGSGDGSVPDRLKPDDLLRSVGRITGFPAKPLWVATCPIAAADAPPDAAGNSPAGFDCFVSLGDNSVASYRLAFADWAVSVTGQAWPRLCRGHEGPVRWAAVSSDGLAVMTLSAGQLRLWQFASLACLLTVKCPAPDATATGGSEEADDDGQRSIRMMTRCEFLPGDRFAAVGTSDGRLVLCDLTDGCATEQLQAHSGPLSSLCRLSDSSGLATGSSQDRKALLWRYEINRDKKLSDSGSGGIGSRLSLLLSRSIELDDCVAALCHTADSRLLCCGLVDNSIRVLFTDSARQFLHLHGHSQPPAALAATADSAMLASGSGDRTIRLWGLQFGDCQRVMRGHELAVTCLMFAPAPGQTRLLVSSGSDRCLRVWDAGKFRRVAALHGHQAPVTCVAAAPGPGGNFLVSVDQDGSVRTWRRCEEPLVLEEQRELEKEAQFEEEMAEQQAEAADAAASGLVARLSLQSVRGAEALMAALERWESESDRSAVKTPVPPGRGTPLDSLADWLGRQPLHDLERAVSALPTVQVGRLLAALKSLAAGGLQPERVCRCAALLVSFHFPCLAAGQVAGDSEFLARLAHCGDSLADMLGFNLAALRLMQASLQDAAGDGAEWVEQGPGGDGKKKQQQQRRRAGKQQRQVFDLRTC